MVSFSPERLRPAWSANRVALAKDDVDREGPLTYYNDLRLDDAHRNGGGTFGNICGVKLDVAHMMAEELINPQFGCLAQMEAVLATRKRGALANSILP